MKRIFIRKVLIFSLSALCAVSVARFCRQKTAGFAIYKICSQLPFCTEFATTSPLSLKEKNAIRALLNQPYHYLGKGAQCFVFVSQDDKYVIKFFKQHNLRLPPIFSYLPLTGSLRTFRDSKAQEKQEDLYRDFRSYKIAFDNLKEDTGLIFLHLNKTQDLHINLTLFDKIGCIHNLWLDDMEFLIQKKGVLFYEGLLDLLQHGETESAKQRLTELVDLMARRSLMGYYDKDPDINTNFGICDGKTVQIDVGRFRPDDSRKHAQRAAEDIFRATDNLRQWLASQDAELCEHLVHEIDKVR